MDTSRNEINNTIMMTEDSRKYTKFSWTPFLRQLFVSSGIFMIYFISGLSFGTPTIYISQIRRVANTSAVISNEMATWLSSAHGYSGLPAVFILILLVHLAGRKIAFIFVCISALASFIVYNIANTPMQLVISEIMLGFVFASNLTVAIMIVSEYSSPKYRGLFLTIKSATFFWGIWAANAIGTFYNWKKIGILGLVCVAYTSTVLVWPESPHWLATKGRFEECAASHRWLKGTDRDSEKELDNLINSQRDYISSCSKHKGLVLRYRLISFVKTILSREFYKPILLSAAIMAQYHVSGKLVCSMYAMQLLKKITQSESTAYIAMLVLDGVTILGMYMGCALSKFLKRRKLLLGSTLAGIVFLFVFSIYLYLVKLSIVVENNVVSILLLTAFSVTISCGPMIMATSIYGELMPLRYKDVGSILIVLISFTLMGTLLKIAPVVFKTFDLHGTFFFYAVSCSFFTVFVYKYLPETKDKTLQEIEQYFNENVTNMAQEADTKELMFIRTSNVNTP